MTLTTTVLRWTARLLLTSIEEAIDWSDIDIASRFDTDRLASAVDWSEVDLREHIDDDQLVQALDWPALPALEEHVEDDLLAAAIVDETEHLVGPVEKLHDLEDDPERIYVWQVETEEAEAQLDRQIRDEFRREFGRGPNAAHFVVADLDRLRVFDPDELAYYVDPAKAGGEA